MYAIKYQCRPFREMAVHEIGNHSLALLIRIHAITGWNIPEHEDYLNPLVSEFTKLLMESYKDLNPEEIAYAVRNYGLEVKDWGKNMNLSLIDKPISEYRRVRKCLSDMEEKKQVPAVAYKPGEQELVSMRRQVIEERYQAYLQGQTGFELQPVNGIETLSADNFCEGDLHKMFIDNAIERIKSALVKEHELLLYKNMLPHAADKQKEIYAVVRQSEKVVMLAKKMALVYCFAAFQKAGFKHIYQPA